MCERQEGPPNRGLEDNSAEGRRSFHRRVPLTDNSEKVLSLPVKREEEEEKFPSQGFHFLLLISFSLPILIIIAKPIIIMPPGSSRSLFSLFSLFLHLFSLLPAHADLAADRSALLRLRSSVLGRTLVWNQSQSDPCAWEGILCSNNNRVVELRLPGDGLSGQIPSGTIGNLTQLRVLSLRQNSLSGQIPSDIGLIPQLREINLRGNRFSGEIPVSLFNLTNLINLDFSSNNLLGEIPISFNNLILLQTMYLENNQLNGVIPNLSNLTQLQNFNVSNNRLNGRIPLILTGFPSNSFMGNSLCGSPLQACSTTDGDIGNGGRSSSEERKLSGGAIAGIAIGSVCGAIIIMSVVFIVWTRKLISIENPEPMPSSSSSSSALVRVESWIETRKGKGEAGSECSDDDDDDGLIFFGVKSFKLRQLLMAAAEVMEKGRFGTTTYRAYVNNNGNDEKKSVIVKRLKDVSVNDNVGEREFRKRVEAIGRLKHENLVALLAYFYGKDERLLVYDDLGSKATSLASVLHGDGCLTWVIRRKVSLEIAKAIEYIHSYDFSHGNINSSNVLLLLHQTTSVSATACLSEFGISPLISSSSNKNNGYWAPEVVDSQRMTQKADVYSFGVLILELLTGKDPSGGMDLARWVHECVDGRDKYWSIHGGVFDQKLVHYDCQKEHQQMVQMVELLHVGISCTSTHQDKRPSIFQVRKRIHQIITY